MSSFLSSASIRTIHSLVRFVIAASFVGTTATPLVAQVSAPSPQQSATAIQPDLPPATKLEGFKPTAGSVVIFAYDELGRIGTSAPRLSVDVRQVRDPRGDSARGLFVDVIESQFRREGSFVDEEELPELLKGIDALMEVTANPSSFKYFEVQYTTRGKLKLTAYNVSTNGKLKYSVEVGRMLTAKILGLDAGDMAKLRDMFKAASQKLDLISTTDK